MNHKHQNYFVCSIALRAREQGTLNREQYTFKGFQDLEMSNALMRSAIELEQENRYCSSNTTRASN